jgi:hypothetical protein
MRFNSDCIYVWTGVFYVLFTDSITGKDTDDLVLLSGLCVDDISFRVLTTLMIVMDDVNDMRQANTLKRTSSLRNIVLKSSLSRVGGPRLSFAHLNPGSAVQHIGELNDLFERVDLQLIAVSETWYKTRHTNRLVGLDGFRVIRADKMVGGVVVDASPCA